ncbi:hypothetical protein [Chryseobacterium sp. T1]
MKKKYVLFFLLMSVFVWSQNKADLQKENTDLKQKNEKLTQEIQKLKENASKASPVKEKKEEFDYQRIIKNNNEIFFTKLFEKNYKDNQTLFSTRGLSKEIDTVAYHNYNVVLDNIIADTSKTKEDQELAKKSIRFNIAYIKLYKLNLDAQTVFDKRYDEELSSKLLKNLELIDLKEFEQLAKTKDLLTEKVEAYSSKTCELKDQLDKYQKLASDNSQNIPAAKYNSLKEKYDYPYLQGLITKMAKDYKSYNSGLLPCK